MTEEILLLMLIWLVFVLLSFIVRDVYLFAVAGIVSLIFGIALALEFLEEGAGWAFGVIGLSIILFGFWLMIFALQSSTKRLDK